MNILYSSSDSYAFLAGISLLSLLENNQSVKEINIYIMDNEISEANKRKLIQIANNYKRTIKFVEMPNMEELTGRIIDTGRWNISTFGRLYMASALPKSVHKVLNIDCDTIILDSIEDLWNVDVNGKVVGGMLECISNRYRRNIDIKDDTDYYNGGIILLNLDEVRLKKYEEKFSSFISEYGSSLTYLDQDVINHVIPQNKKVTLPLKYNMVSIYYYASYEQVLKIRRSEYFYSKTEFELAKEQPCILHFTSCFLDGLRPWIKGNEHPYRDDFFKYKRMSPWKDDDLQIDTRNVLLKIRSIIIKRLPKTVVCEIASVLHGIIVPNRSYRKMQKMRIKAKNEN